jgi:hypothetical protein
METEAANETFPVAVTIRSLPVYDLIVNEDGRRISNAGLEEILASTWTPSPRLAESKGEGRTG